MPRHAWPAIFVVALLSWAAPPRATAQSTVPPAGTSAPAPNRTATPPLRASRPLDRNRVAQAPPRDADGELIVPDLRRPRRARREPTLDEILHLKTASVDPVDIPFPINLATALRLSDARPLIVASAQASVWVAEARLTRAKLLWVPMLTLGFDYIRHDGGGPDFNRGLLTAPSVSFFYGGGGLIGSVNLTDVIFEPLAQRQVLTSRHWDIQSAKNDALYETANTYFRVHQYRGKYAGNLYCVALGNDLVAKIEKIAADLAQPVEADRAKNLLAFLEQQATNSREMWRVKSADLTQLLRLDPRTVIVPQEHDHLQISLIDPALSLDDLMPVALRNRPEIASKQATVREKEYTVRREKMRPLLPMIQINGFQSAANGLINGGIFAFGPNYSLNQWTGRFDESIQVVWQLEGLGIGNLARIKRQRGEQSKAVIDLFDEQDRVASDVTQAHAHLQSAAARVGQAERSLRTGLITYLESYEGLGQTSRFGDVLMLIYRPQEVVYALKLLNIAFDEYFTTVADYNRAQFELFHSLGYPAAEIAVLRPPGDVEPVSTERPPYLPPVGNGPPPATR